nr:Scyampcin [Scylla paramamosain]
MPLAWTATRDIAVVCRRCVSEGTPVHPRKQMNQRTQLKQMDKEGKKKKRNMMKTKEPGIIFFFTSVHEEN